MMQYLTSRWCQRSLLQDCISADVVWPRCQFVSNHFLLSLYATRSVDFQRSSSFPCCVFHGFCLAVPSALFTFLFIISFPQALTSASVWPLHVLCADWRFYFPCKGSLFAYCLSFILPFSLVSSLSIVYLCLYCFVHCFWFPSCCLLSFMLISPCCPFLLPEKRNWEWDWECGNCYVPKMGNLSQEGARIVSSLSFTAISMRSSFAMHSSGSSFAPNAGTWELSRCSIWLTVARFHVAYSMDFVLLFLQLSLLFYLSFHFHRLRLLHLSGLYMYFAPIEDFTFFAKSHFLLTVSLLFFLFRLFRLCLLSIYVYTVLYTVFDFHLAVYYLSCWFRLVVHFFYQRNETENGIENAEIAMCPRWGT